MTSAYLIPHFAVLLSAARNAAWLLLCLLLPLRLATAQQHKTWKDYGSGPDSSKFMNLD
jgi:hypothetical protein